MYKVRWGETAGTVILASNTRSKMIYNPPPPHPQSTPLKPGIRLGRRHKQTPCVGRQTKPSFLCRGEGGGVYTYINFDLVLEAKIGVPAEPV